MLPGALGKWVETAATMIPMPGATMIPMPGATMIPMPGANQVEENPAVGIPRAGQVRRVQV